MTQDRGKWRDICERMVREQDPAKISELAVQLMAALDEQELGIAPSTRVLRSESPELESNNGSSAASVR